MADRHQAPPDQTYPGPVLASEHHIRLVSLQPGSDESIRCELITTDLDAAPAYEALSYTWGDPLDRQAIQITTATPAEQIEFLVTSNCFSALHHLRQNHKPRLLWIDALCIDQSNLLERNHQVTLMSRIYSQAAEVVIYLGESAQNSDMAIDFIMDCDNPSFETTSLSYPKSELLVQALRSFFHRPWFTRVWVIQEVVLSNSGVVYCGSRSLPWSAIKNFKEWNQNKDWLTKVPFVVSTSKKSLIKFDIGSSMLKALVDSRHCDATNPRDKIYSLLPLFHIFEERLSIVPKYGDTVAKVYMDCATALISQQGLSILNAVQGRSRTENLPSWVPDWSISPQRTVLGAVERIAMKIPFDPNGAAETLQGPRVMLRKSLDPSVNDTGAILRMFGCLYDEVAKMGSVYIAGKGIFPLREWMGFMIEEVVINAHGPRKLSWDGHDWYLEKEFHLVIGAAGYEYQYAIQEFVEDEEEAGKEITDPPIDDPDNWVIPKVSWEAEVHKVALQMDHENLLQGGSLLHRDIPFHDAGRTMPYSYMRYVQDVLRNCHSRRFFITKKGLMGIAPAETSVGDHVCMLVGTTMPFILRETREGPYRQNLKQYQLVGECYMESKVMKDLKYTPGTIEQIEIV